MATFSGHEDDTEPLRLRRRRHGCRPGPTQKRLPALSTFIPSGVRSPSTPPSLGPNLAAGQAIAVHVEDADVPARRVVDEQLRLVEGEAEPVRLAEIVDQKPQLAVRPDQIDAAEIAAPTRAERRSMAGGRNRDR